MIEVEIYRKGVESPIVVTADDLPGDEEVWDAYLARICDGQHVNRPHSRTLLMFDVDDLSHVVIVTGVGEPGETVEMEGGW